MSFTQRSIIVDPSYAVYAQNRLFDITDPVLNRDGTLLPFHRLRHVLNEQGVGVYTADYLLEGKIEHPINEYYSLGLLTHYPQLLGRQDVRLRGFLIMEPPVVAPKLYRALPELTRHFEQVYLHNTVGDGYSLQSVDQSKLRKLYWPQPYEDVLEPWWGNNRQHRIVVINGNHIPRSLRGQLYGKRIEAMAHLAKIGMVDLYGRGWDQWWSHRSMWPPYWLNYRTLMSIYRGPCESKYEVLSRYSFSLCFENMVMEGYLTEKIFDCFYAGTIPIYLGANDIKQLIPYKAYIDCRNFNSWDDLFDKISSMPKKELITLREAGRSFIRSEEYQKYFNSLINIFEE